MDLAPNDPAIRDTEGRLYTLMASEEEIPRVAQEYLERAEDVFNRNIKREPSEPYAYRHLADAYLVWSGKTQDSGEQLRYTGMAYQAL
jgi:hypothetical protein